MIFSLILILYVFPMMLNLLFLATLCDAMYIVATDEEKRQLHYGFVSAFIPVYNGYLTYHYIKPLWSIE